MRRFLAVSLLSSSLSFAAGWAQADLDAAVAQGSWAEVLDHAEDLPPSARNDKWRSAVTEAASNVLEKTTPPADKPFAVVDRAQTLVARYAFLEKAPRFITARGKLTQTTLEQCVKDDRDDCLEKLKAGLDALSGAAAMEAAKVVRRGFNADGAMPLILRAVTGQASLCGDALTSEVTLFALDLPADYPRAADARKVAFEVCWAQLGPALKKSQAGASKSRLANSCAGMRAKKALSELQEDVCKEED